MENHVYAETQRVLSYCLMRQGNFLRQMGKPEEALPLVSENYRGTSFWG